MTTYAAIILLCAWGVVLSFVLGLFFGFLLGVDLERRRAAKGGAA